MKIYNKNQFVLLGLAFLLLGLSACGQSSFKKAKVLNEQGLVDFEKGLFDAAIDKYDQAILISPKYGPSYNNRGHAYTVNQQFALALMDYKKAIELDSDDFETYANRGLCYYYQDNVDQAFDDYNKAIELNPKDGDAYRYRGFVYFYNKKDTFQGCSDWRKACELDETLCEAYEKEKQKGGCIL